MTGEIRDFNCNSWNCPVCVPKIAWKYACRVAYARPERMITLTNVPHDRQKARLAWIQLARDIRAKTPFEYAKFVEVGHKTGMLHWHLAEVGGYIPQRWLSARAEANGLGKIVDIRKCYGEGPSFYLSKYITKEGAPVDWRKVSFSRGFPRAVPMPANDDWQLRGPKKKLRWDDDDLQLQRN